MAQMIQNGVGNSGSAGKQLVRNTRQATPLYGGSSTNTAPPVGGQANATPTRASKKLPSKKQATRNNFGMAGSSASAARANKKNTYSGPPKRGDHATKSGGGY